MAATWLDAAFDPSELSGHALIALKKALAASGLPVGDAVWISRGENRALQLCHGAGTDRFMVLPDDRLRLGNGATKVGSGGEITLRIDYLYRDASNNKLHGEHLLRGAADDADLSVIATALGGGERYFDPSDFGMPNLLEASEWGYDADDDMSWHELSGLSIVPDAIAGAGSLANLVSRCRARLGIRPA